MMMDPLSEARSHSCINMCSVTSDAVFGQRTLLWSGITTLDWRAWRQ